MASAKTLGRPSKTKAIGGREFLFYAFRPPMVAELLGLGATLSSSIATFMDKGEGDRGFKSRTINTDDTAGKAEQSESEHLPASLDVIKFRAEQRSNAIKSFTEALIGKESRNLLARIVCDSMRDEFDEGGAAQEDVEEFWNSLDLGLAAEFVSGAMEANVSVIRPLVERVGLNWRSELQAALSQAITPAAPAVSTAPAPAAPPGRPPLTLIPKAPVEAPTS